MSYRPILCLGKFVWLWMWCVCLLTLATSGCWRGKTPPANAKAAAKKGADGKDEGEKPEDKDAASDDALDKELAKKKKKPEKKPPFEVKDFRVVPFDRPLDPDQASTGLEYIKPGHWVTTVRSIKANDDNFAGQLRAHLLKTGGGERTLPATRYWMEYSRSVALTKGNTRYPELEIFAPLLSDERFSISLSSQLALAGKGRPLSTGELHGLQFMLPHEFYLVVLAADPNPHSYWRLSEVARPNKVPAAFSMNQDILAENAEELEKQARENRNQEEAKRNVHYRVCLPQLEPEEPAPLPHSAIGWSTIACLVWDDFDPERLARTQQQAMLDWLHWGGQLIISGPNSLEKLRGTFLQPYLPAMPDVAISLTTEDMAQLSQGWTHSSQNPLRLVKPIAGIKLLPQTESLASPVRTLLSTPQGGPLVVERECGRGRIVTTAFRLSERGVQNNWGGFDNFVNGVLLRHPPRRFFENLAADGSFPLWAGKIGYSFDGRMLSNVRYFSRDAQTWEEYRTWEDQFENFGRLLSSELAQDNGGATFTTPVVPRLGCGEWSDRDAVSDAARAALRLSSGIEIPKAEFVLWVTACYLLVLVPVNYLIFRGLGRLEWAWLAVPVLALGGAGAVIHLAQLEIGFVSSYSEIAVLELQGSYQRGHVTRYGALYTSLADDFSFQFDDPGGRALPFARDPNFTLESLERPNKVTFQGVNARSGKQRTQMSGMRVISNDTDFIRAEHMLPLTGGLEIQSIEGNVVTLANSTPLSFSQALLVQSNGLEERTHTVSLSLGWVGECKPGSVVKVNLGREDFDLSQRDKAAMVTQLVPQWLAATQPDLPAGGGGRGSKDRSPPNLLTLQTLALFDAGEFAAGRIRLLAVLDGELAGLEVYPKPAQRRTSTFVVAHLRNPDRSAPTSDVNAPVKRQLPGQELPEEAPGA